MTLSDAINKKFTMIIFRNRIKVIRLLIFLLLPTGLLIAQNRDPYHNRLILAPNEGTGIQYITIYDPIVLREIRAFIKEFSDSSTLFKEGFGFLILENFVKKGLVPIPVEELSNHENDIVLSFKIKARSHSLNPIGDLSPHPYSSRFPTFYAKVDNRLILIFENNIEQVSFFSRNSKEKLAGEVKNTLLKALDPNFEFYGINSKFYKISFERRKKMKENDFIDEAWCTYCSTPKSDRVVFIHFNGDVSYK